MRFTVSYQPQQRAHITGDSRAELRALLADVERADTIQFLLDKTDADETLIAYFNVHRAFFIWLGSDGEWLQPIDPNWHKLGAEYEECYIENGQLDEYPIRTSTPKVEAVKILTHYFERGELAPWVEWTDENYWE